MQSVRSRVKSITEGSVCLAVLVLLAAVATGHILYNGTLPVDGAALLSMPPWQEANTAGAMSATEPLDLAAQRYFPWYAHLHDSVMAGDSLFWNAMEGCGMPFFALWQTRCLSPFSLPLYTPLPIETALAISVFLKLLVAGISAYALARTFKTRPPFALFAGVSWMLSGPVFLHMLAPIADVMAWLPLWFIAVNRLTLGKAKCWPCAALLITAMLLGGNPGAACVCLVWSALFFLLRAVLAWRRPDAPRHSAFAFLFTVILGAGLAAVQIVPFIEFARQARTTGFESIDPRLHWGALVQLFFPHFFGTGYTELGFHRPFADMGMHAGLIGIALLPLWFAVRASVAEPKRRGIEALLLTALISIFTALILSAFAAGSLIEKWFSPALFLTPNALALALAAACAADEWLQLDITPLKTALKRLLIYWPALALIALILAAIQWSSPRPHAPGLFTQTAFSGGFIFLTILLIIGSIFRPSPRIMGATLTALAFLSLFFTYESLMPCAPTATVFPNTSFLDGLRTSGQRVCGAADMREWPLTPNGAPQFYVTGGAELERHAAFVERLAQDPLLTLRTGSPWLFLTKNDLQGPLAIMRPELKIEQVFTEGAVLCRALNGRPRAWMAYRHRVSPAYNPSEIRSDAPPLVEIAELPEPPPGPEATPAITDASNAGALRIQIGDTRPGLLIIADAWYPGWTATVDGNRTTLLAVDGLFRGIPLAAGPHDVLLRYQPASIISGLWITIGTAGVALLAMLITAITTLRARHAKRLRR